MEIITKACNACNADVVRLACQFKKGAKHTFCNRSCRHNYYLYEKICRGCSAIFMRDSSQPKRQYCSWECFKYSRHVQLLCVVCNKLFDSYVSEHRKRIHRNHVTCCSRSCRNTYTSLLLGGDGNWVEGGQYNVKRQRGYTWRLVRDAYMKHVGGVCEGCGGSATQVHHLYPVAAGGELYDFDNLMAACSDCHDNMHTQLRNGAFWCSLEVACENI